MTGRRALSIVAGAAAALAFILATDAWAPRGLPLGIVLMGLLIGSLNGLVALGLVLIHRAGRYVNFAQGGLGAVGAVVAAKLIVVNDVPYLIAVVVGLAISVVLAVLAEILFVRRLFTAPRLIVTVATIGLAQLFGAFEVIAGLFWNSSAVIAIPRMEFPVTITASVGDVLFQGEHLVVVLVFPLVLAALFAFFRYTMFGAAVQAAAENGSRAGLLGIDVKRVSTVTWMIAGLLAGITAVLQAPIVGFTFGTAAGPGLLLRALAPAMIARMNGLGTTVVAALGLGVLEQAIVWNTNDSAPVDVALFVIILGALLVQRRHQARTTEGEESSFSAASRIRPFPRELARLTAVRIGRNWARAVPLAVAVLVPVTLSVSQLNLASLLLVYAIAALSLTVLSGFAGQISFGHWAFVGFGALFGGWVFTGLGWNAVLAAIAAIVGGTLLALAIGIPALRIRGLFLAVTTLAFAVATANFLFRLPVFQVTPGLRRPRFGRFDLEDERTFYYLCLVALLVTIALVRNLRNGRWGRGIVAVRDNDRAAASYGVGVVTSRLVAFGVSGALASFAGFLYMLNQTTVDPGAFPVETSLLLFSAVVIGGMGSIPGAIIGALYLRGIEFFVPSLQLFSTSLGLLLVLMFAPGGLGGLAFQARDALLRWLANRWQIVVPSLVADKRVEAPSALSLPDEPADREPVGIAEEIGV